MSYRRDLRAFTLIEMLVVIAVIAILAATLVPAARKAIANAEITTARNEVESLVAVVKSYEMEYRGYPTSKNGQPADAHYGVQRGSVVDNREVMNVLRAIDGPGNVGHVLNRQKHVYIEPKEKSLDSGGNLIDPWGRQYEITMDTQFNNEVNNLPDGIADIKGRGVIVWSAGPDGQPNTKDDLRSWK